MELPIKKLNELPENFISSFQKDPNLFEAFICKNKKYIIRSAFVFQIQVLDENLPTFVIHIRPTFNGKANSQINDLYKYFNNVAKNHNIIIRSYAFDGDGGYKVLHETYYQSYISNILSREKTFFIHLNCQRVVCDPLHLFKRINYRLLNNIIHSGFLKTSPFIKINQIIKIKVLLVWSIFPQLQPVLLH